MDINKITEDNMKEIDRMIQECEEQDKKQEEKNTIDDKIDFWDIFKKGIDKIMEDYAKKGLRPAIILKNSDELMKLNEKIVEVINSDDIKKQDLVINFQKEIIKLFKEFKEQLDKEFDK